MLGLVDVEVVSAGVSGDSCGLPSPGLVAEGADCGVDCDLDCGLDCCADPLGATWDLVSSSRAISAFIPVVKAPFASLLLRRGAICWKITCPTNSSGRRFSSPGATSTSMA